MKIISPKISRLVGGKIYETMDRSLEPIITIPVASKVSNGFFAEPRGLLESMNVSGKSVLIHEPIIDLLEKLHGFTREYTF